MKDRQKGRIVSAPEGSWYHPYIGKYLWVSKRSYNEDTKKINLKYCNTHLSLAKEDLCIVPWPLRKLVHTINSEIEIVPEEEVPEMELNLEDE